MESNSPYPEPEGPVAQLYVLTKIFYDETNEGALTANLMSCQVGIALCGGEPALVPRMNGIPDQKISAESIPGMIVVPEADAFCSNAPIGSHEAQVERFRQLADEIASGARTLGQVNNMLELETGMIVQANRSGGLAFYADAVLNAMAPVMRP